MVMTPVQMMEQRAGIGALAPHAAQSFAPAPEAPAAESGLSPGRIVTLVEEQERRTDKLRSRWESDYELYLLHEPVVEEGYQQYITSEPMYFADKVMALLTDADLLIRFPVESKKAQQRDAEDIKEKFISGALRAADDAMLRMMLPTVRSQLVTYITLRGRYGGRVLLYREPDGATGIEVMPWDPLHTFYALGAKGVAWACYRMARTKEQIFAEYGVTAPTQRSGADETVEVYDYYDGRHNAVCLSGEWLKPPTPHGFPSIPVFLGIVGPMPPLRPAGILDAATNTEEQYGESVFKSNRHIYKSFNATMSDMRTLVRRSVKQGVKIFSQDGRKTLDNDPYREGAVLSLKKSVEDVEPLGLLEMARETGAFLGQVSGDVQRGSFPHSVYGELGFAISGFAITQLQQATTTVIQPRVQALSNAYRQIVSLLLSEMATGMFAPTELSGFTLTREYFSRTFTPDELRGRALPEVTVVPNLPEDDPAKFAMVKMAREGPNPLLPDRILIDRYLKIPNVDAVRNILKEERAEGMSPVALLWTTIEALKAQGRDDLAMIYLRDLNKLIMEMMAGTGGPGAASPGQPGEAGEPPPGFDPRIAPNSMMGAPPPTPVPQGALPLRPPGAPRPGAQSDMMGMNGSRMGG